MKKIYAILFSSALLAGSSHSLWAQSDQSTVLGYQAGMGITSGLSNTFLGYQSGKATSSGSGNTFIGYNTGPVNTTGTQNVFIGSQAGFSNTTGGSNLFMGYLAGYSNSVGGGNVFLGNGAGIANVNGGSNTFIGASTGQGNSTGNQNVFIGTLAGNQNSTGGSNLFIGNLTGYYNNASNNVFLGNGAGLENTAGSSNIFIGSNTGLHNTSGSSNIFLGAASGLTNTSGSSNMLLGNGSNTGSANLTNAIAIGTNAQVNISNALILGNNANVGIGNSAPSNKLEITQGTAGNSGLRFTNLTSAVTPGISTNQFLTVNSSGDVVLAQVGSSKGSFRSATTIDSVNLWSSDGLHLQNANSQGGVIIGPGVANTPAGYRLYVADGVLTEKVKVAVKSSADWSDYVLAPDYKLIPLAEVESHIQQKGHLPGIPSAREMVEKGNDLHQTDAKLLAKIEELTLYSIQLEKKLQTKTQHQQAEINQLKQLVNQLLEKK